MSANYPAYSMPVQFTLPINNKRDRHMTQMISGNSLDEIEQSAVRLANDYGRKNADIKDPNKPVRFTIYDAKGNPVVNWANGVFDFIQDIFEDKNDEEGTPTTLQAGTVGK